MPWGLQQEPDTRFSFDQLKRVVGREFDPKLEEAVTDLLRNGHETQRALNLNLSEQGVEGARLLVGVQNTLLSPQRKNGEDYVRSALGGCRVGVYADEAGAQSDVDQLSRGMTYKWAILNRIMMHLYMRGEASPAEIEASRVGGGKSVIYLPDSDNVRLDDLMLGEGNLAFREELMQQVAGHVNGLKGRYILAADMRTNLETMNLASRHTELMVCKSVENGGSGDPSIVTAEGGFYGMKAAIRDAYGKRSFGRLKIGIQGLGKTGKILLRRILEDHKEFGHLVLTDTSADAIEKARELLSEHGIDEKRYTFVEPEDFYTQGVEVYAPCARGQTLSMENLERMRKLQVVAGLANNQRHPDQKPEVDAFLIANDIAYVPDYIINLGGILNVKYEGQELMAANYGRYHQPRPVAVIRALDWVVADVLQRSKDERIPAQAIADTIVHEHLAGVAAVSRHTPQQVRNQAYLRT